MVALVALALAGCKLETQVLGNGAGKITSSNGIQCSNTEQKCSVTNFGNNITLTAEPAPGSTFQKWTGVCAGQSNVCNIKAKGNIRTFAHFSSQTPLVLDCGAENAKAGCLSPKFPPEYYIDQSIKYFLTMESSVSVFVQPNYSDEVIRWEWAPWLILTGYTRANLIWTDVLLKLHPTKYDSIDCRAFDTQPFGRCRVVFDYSGEKCPIYEEFVFNDKGEMTFIEAWSDYPSLVPMKDAVADPWGEGQDVSRLSTRVPGLGNANGLINKNGAGMLAVASQDADVADMQRRLNKPFSAWFKELADNKEAVAQGCKPPKE